MRCNRLKLDSMAWGRIGENREVRVLHMLQGLIGETLFSVLRVGEKKRRRDRERHRDVALYSGFLTRRYNTKTGHFGAIMLKNAWLPSNPHIAITQSKQNNFLILFLADSCNI